MCKNIGGYSYDYDAEALKNFFAVQNDQLMYCFLNEKKNISTLYLLTFLNLYLLIFAWMKELNLYFGFHESIFFFLAKLSTRSPKYRIWILLPPLQRTVRMRPLTTVRVCDWAWTADGLKAQTLHVHLYNLRQGAFHSVKIYSCLCCLDADWLKRFYIGTLQGRCSNAHQVERGLAMLSVSESLSSAFVFPPFWTSVFDVCQTSAFECLAWMWGEGNADHRRPWNLGITRDQWSYVQAATWCNGCDLTRPARGEQKPPREQFVFCSKRFKEMSESIGCSLTTESWPKLFLRFCAVPDPGFCQKINTQNHFKKKKKMSAIQWFHVCAERNLCSQHLKAGRVGFCV